MRINKYLARCGIGSRRKCDEYIKNGEIKINGTIIADFSYSVSFDQSTVFGIFFNNDLYSFSLQS